MSFLLKIELVPARLCGGRLQKAEGLAGGKKTDLCMWHWIISVKAHILEE